MNMEVFQPPVRSDRPPRHVPALQLMYGYMVLEFLRIFIFFCFTRRNVKNPELPRRVSKIGSVALVRHGREKPFRWPRLQAARL